MTTTAEPQAPTVDADAVAASIPAPAAHTAPRVLSPEQKAIVEGGRGVNAMRIAEQRAKAALPPEQSATPEPPAAPSGPSLDDLRARAKQDPLAVLKDLGLDYPTITDAMLSPGASPQTKSDIEAVRAELEQLKQAQAAKELAAQEAQWKSGLSAQVKASAEKYELLSGLDDAAEIVASVTHSYYQRTKRLLSFDEAAAAVEADLEAQAERLLKANKVRTKLGQTAAPQTAGQTNAAPKTLTNSAMPVSATSKSPFVDPSYRDD